jgi:hypothetical protein
MNSRTSTTTISVGLLLLCSVAFGKQRLRLAGCDPARDDVARMGCWPSLGSSSPVAVLVWADGGVAHSAGPLRQE